MARGAATTEGRYGKFEAKPSEFEGKTEKRRGTRTRNKRKMRRRRGRR